MGRQGCNMTPVFSGLHNFYIAYCSIEIPPKIKVHGTGLSGCCNCEEVAVVDIERLK